jgi:hypothetical protein
MYVRGGALMLLLAGALALGAQTPPDPRRSERRLEQIYRKYLRGRLTTEEAARRMLDRARTDSTPQDALYGVLASDLESAPAEERDKTTTLLEEMDRQLVARSRSHATP